MCIDPERGSKKKGRKGNKNPQGSRGRKKGANPLEIRRQLRGIRTTIYKKKKEGWAELWRGEGIEEKR